MTTANPILTTIDFEKEGKQTGYLRLPHSVHRSAYGWIPFPVACIRNGEGPTVLLLAGTHGDEYEGQLTLSKLICQLEPKDINGRLIILPMLNFPAAKAGLRTSPIDELNLNRVYPGDPDGSPTLVIAHYLETVLMPMADYGLDLHSGGSSLHYVPSAVGAFETDTERLAEIQRLMKTFGAPYSFFFPGGHAAGTSANHAARRQNVLMFGTEMGGSGTITPECLRICEEGVHRFLSEIGILHKKGVSLAEKESRMLYAPDFSFFTYADGEGLFEPVAQLGSEAKRGDLAGYVHTPETPGSKPEPICFEAGGVVVCQRIPGRVLRGDCLYHLGCDF
jgi:predicted deacylase